MAILTALGLWKQWPQGVWITTLVLSLYHLSLGPFLTLPLIPSFKVVTTLGKLLGDVIFTAVFTLVYYTLYSPISLILRMAGKDHIARDSKTPHWEDFSPQANDPKQIEKLF